MNEQNEQPAAWSAVWSLALGIALLTGAELLPASLLTPIARDLGVTEGATGLAVTATAGVALFASLFVAPMTQKLDRRVLVLALCVFQIASNVLVAKAPNMPVLAAGRVMLGVSIGATWALAAVLATRLVPKESVPKALSIIFGGSSIASVAAAPVAIFVGNQVGWRGVFLLVAGLGGAAFLAQLLTVPALPPQAQAASGSFRAVLARPTVRPGLLAAFLAFAGHSAFFTYLRPFLENVARVQPNAVSGILGVFGLGCIVGTFAAGPIVRGHLRAVQIAGPLLMAALAVVLMLFGSSVAVTAVGVGVWGALFGSVPVAWSTWLTRVLPDEAERGGGLLVAAIQIAIATGAAVGGVAYDRFGATGAVAAGAIIVLIAAIETAVLVRGGEEPATAS